MTTSNITRRSALAMFAGLILLGIEESAFAADDDDYDLIYTTPDKWLQVWSDHKIEAARCKSITDRIRTAYQFDNQQEAWKDQDVLFKNPLKVRVLGEIRSGMLGLAQGPNLFIVQDSYLDDPLSEGTLAHELTHVQDNRQLKGGKLPSFMMEGRALTNGHNYRVSLAQPDNQYDRKMALSAVQFTSSDAEEILSKSHDAGWDMQAMGTFLVEYMRTQWKGGVLDIHPRLSRMVGIIAGGLEFEAAFEKEFTTTFKDLGTSFLGYLDKTSKNPEVRLEKTIWQNLANEADDEE